MENLIMDNKISYQDAKIQILENQLKKVARDRDEYKMQLDAANKEIEILKNEKNNND